MLGLLAAAFILAMASAGSANSQDIAQMTSEELERHVNRVILLGWPLMVLAPIYLAILGISRLVLPWYRQPEPTT